jgi:hypothetical protein
MVLVILYLAVLALFLRGRKFTAGGAARRQGQTAPNAGDADAPPPERLAGVWRWDRLESIGTSASRTRGGPVSPRAVAPAVPLEWTALDDLQLNRLLKQSWSRND